MIVYPVSLSPPAASVMAVVRDVPDVRYIADSQASALEGVEASLRRQLIRLWAAGQPMPPCSPVNVGDIGITAPIHWCHC